jgi:mannose-6-phosphate isomerase-like protein (cupin superfamily)
MVWFGEPLMASCLSDPVFVTQGQVYPLIHTMGAYTDMGSYQGTELKTRMTATQKIKAKKAVGTGRMAARTIPADAKKNAPLKKKTAKLAPPVMYGAMATSFYHVKHEGEKSHTVSEAEKANAHSIHTSAKKDAQVKKNVANAASHYQHEHAGKESHAVDAEKAVAIKAGSHDAKVGAHNPHQYPDLSARKVPGHEKTRVHKTGKKGFVANIEEETRKNRDFRRVLYTGKHCQLVLMSLKPGEDIGLETHGDVDQFFRFEAGQGIVQIDGVNHAVKDGSGVIVPCGAIHNVTNTSETEFLKLYTIYSPPEHKDKVVRKTKREALATEEHFDGKTTDKYQ